MDPRLLPTLLGLGMISCLFAVLPEMLRKRRRTRSARGKVVGCSTEETTSTEVGSHSPPTFHAVVEFEAEDRSYKVISGSGVSWKRPKLGETRTVEYEPGNPENCGVKEGWLSEFAGLWGPGLGLPLAGAILLLWTWLPR